MSNIHAEEGFVWKQKLDKHGHSYYLHVNKELMEYLGLKRASDGDYYVVVKADVSPTHGHFIGFGKIKEKVSP